jgi:hypothetical protein
VPSTSTRTGPSIQSTFTLSTSNIPNQTRNFRDKTFNAIGYTGMSLSIAYGSVGMGEELLKVDFLFLTESRWLTTSPLQVLDAVCEEDPTCANLVPDAFKGSDSLLSSPFVRTIFFPDYPLPLRSWDGDTAPEPGRYDRS